MLHVILFNGGPVETHYATWEDVQMFFSILEPGDGYTAVLVTDREGKEVIACRVQ